MTTSLKEMISNFVKLDKFDGDNFVRWQKKDEILTYYICMIHILNAMLDSLFDIYQSNQSTKDARDKLESRYMQKNVTIKKFYVMEQLYEN